MTETQIVVDNLAVLSRELDKAVAKLGELDAVRIAAEGDYKLAYSRAFRNASGSVEDRKQQATETCDALWRTWSLAESTVAVQKAHLRALHARVDVGRSIFSARKTEVGLAQMGGAP
ncbi:hypothetical protein [Nocardiopsis sp. YSL2]|uniref:hypothetical protein n=1 Tax=Nocardiopsis sp. YSL2 TaxID=2939492 RepID=UPI0026F43A18|nr:hypothetical protein [Nocardiopsis sp. YSL2]